MSIYTATYQGNKIEARQGDDGLYRAHVQRVARFEFELMEDVKAAKYGRTVIRRAVKVLQDEQINRLKEMDWSLIKAAADSIDFYTEDELKQMLKAFEGTDALTLPGVPFSYNEIGKALLRLDNIKGATEALEDFRNE